MINTFLKTLYVSWGKLFEELQKALKSNFFKSGPKLYETEN